MASRGFSVDRVRHGAQKRELCLPRIEARVLHHDRHIRYDHAGEIRALGHGLRFGEVIEPQMTGALRLDGETIGADRRAIREVDRDLDMCGLASRIQDAHRFMAHEFARRSGRGRRNVAFGNRPDTASNGRRHHLPRPFCTKPPIRPVCRSRAMPAFAPNGWPPKPGRILAMARAQARLSPREAINWMTDCVITGIGTSMCSASSTSQSTSPVSSTYGATALSPPSSRYICSINSTSQERITEPRVHKCRMSAIASLSR